MKNRKVTQLFAGLMVTAMVVTGVLPPSTAMAATKTVTIKTQKQLQTALKDKKVTSIIIKTSKGTTFTIKDGDYGKKNLIVSAPKATVKNSGDFKKIEIRDSKVVYDKGDGNNIVVKDTNTLKLDTSEKSSDYRITVSAKGGRISLGNNGSADVNVVLDKKASLTVRSGAILESLTINADATVKISAGAVVKKLSIVGNAQNVALKIDGTVGSVAVNNKANVSVSGSTITQNVAGLDVAPQQVDIAVPTELDAVPDGSAGNSNTVEEANQDTIVLGGYTTEIPASVSGGTVGNVTEQSKLELPAEIIFTVDGNTDETYTLPVDWYCNDDCGYGGHAKSFTFQAVIKGDYPVALKSGLNMPTATVVIGKGSQSAPADLQKISVTSATIRVGNESKAENITYCINTQNQLPESPEWVASGLFTGLTAGTDYYVFAKYTGNDDYEESAVSQPLTVTTKTEPKESISGIRIRTASDQADPGDTDITCYGDDLNLEKQTDPDDKGATVYRLTGTVNCCTNPESIVINQESVQKPGYYVPLMITVDKDHAPSASETAGLNAMFVKTELSENEKKVIVRTVNATDMQGYQSLLLYLPETGAEKYYFEIDLDGAGEYYKPSLYCIDVSNATINPAGNHF